MKPLLKPRWKPLLGWAVLVLSGLFSTWVIYQRPVIYAGPAPAPTAPPTGPDVVAQAVKDLEAIKASPWLRGSVAGPSENSTHIIAPSPEAAALAADAAATDAADPSLKGAVVVSSGKRRYLVLGDKRYRVGARIGTGEEIRALNLQSVELVSPEGRARRVDIGRGIGLPAQPFAW